jgi:thiosulfate dehydrogenase (quinone) large subunit
MEMSLIESVRPRSATVIPEPPIARFLFADTRMAWFWLIVRLYMGYQFLTAGLEKVFGMDYTIGSTFNTAVQGGGWIFNRQVPLGTQMAGFAKGAIGKAAGDHPAVQGWYADFLKNVVAPNAGFWAFLISFGEVAVGVGLIVGLLTGIAAFFGLFMNLNFLLAGTVSVNPILGVLGIFIVLAWRIAGYYGVDRWLLPLLGTPWTGQLAGKSDEEITHSTANPPVPAMS